MENVAAPRNQEAGLPFDYDSLQAAIGQLRAKQVFFLGAMPKSGTTWLQRMLDTHPEVCCTGEAHLANALMPKLKTLLEQHNALMKYKNEVALEGLSRAALFSEQDLHFLTASAIALLLMSSSRGRAAKAIGEKTPDNLVHFPLLASLFPRAKFITIVRDPRDCAMSAWFHNLRLGSPEMPKRFKTQDEFVDFVAAQWARSVSYSIKLRETHPGRIRMIRYEDLLSHPERLLADLFAFLTVDTSPDILGKCIEAGAFETMTGGRRAGVEDRGAFLRQGTAGDWRNHVDEDAQARVLKIAGPVMRRLDYS